MHRPATLLAALALLLAACEPKPTAPQLSDQYALVWVDGRPVPAVVDSFVTAEGRTRLRRITGRFLVAVSRDSMQYTTRGDVMERASGGGLTTVAVECSSVRVAWRRVGSSVLLDYTGFPSPPTPAVDTLRIAGPGLLQKLRQGDPADDAYVLSYIGDALVLNGCF